MHKVLHVKHWQIRSSHIRGSSANKKSMPEKSMSQNRKSMSENKESTFLNNKFHPAGLHTIANTRFVPKSEKTNIEQSKCILLVVPFCT